MRQPENLEDWRRRSLRAARESHFRRLLRSIEDRARGRSTFARRMAVLRVRPHQAVIAGDPQKQETRLLAYSVLRDFNPDLVVLYPGTPVCCPETLQEPSPTWGPFTECRLSTCAKTSLAARPLPRMRTRAALFPRVLDGLCHQTENLGIVEKAPHVLTSGAIAKQPDIAGGME
jgi:hypothetical protein